MFGVEKIGNYDVRKIGDNKYSVALNNGNIGACVMDEKAVEELRKKYGADKDIFEKKRKTAIALSGATALTMGTLAITKPKFMGGLRRIVKSITSKKMPVWATKLGAFSVAAIPFLVLGAIIANKKAD